MDSPSIRGKMLCYIAIGLISRSPMNPTGVGDSPYQSESAFAGNPDFISLDHMISEGLLRLEETRQKYEQARSLDNRQSFLTEDCKELKRELLHDVYQRFRIKLENNASRSSVSAKSTYLSQENFTKFLNKNKEWLDDYVLYRALKAHFGDIPWYDCDHNIALRNTEKLSEYSMMLREEIGFIQFLQYTFFYEWDELKTYAKAKGVRLIGDMPHFVAADSSDVWVNRSLFVLDERGRPAKMAGVPPDYFSKTGQLWGNPIYDWYAIVRDAV